MDHDTELELNKIEGLLKKVEIKVDGLRAFLSGNELDKDDRGMVGKVNDLEQRIASLEKWKDRIFFLMIGMGLPAGVGVWEIFKDLFTK